MTEIEPAQSALGLHALMAGQRQVNWMSCLVRASEQDVHATRVSHGGFVPARNTPGGRLPSDGVPDARDIGPVDADRIRVALTGLRAAEDELEKSVAQALLNGASVRAVAELSLSPNTVQKYGRAHGWPTDLNRARFYESNWDRDERERRDQPSG